MSSQPSPWALESCRVSLFIQETIDSVDAAFAAITGQAPDTSTINRQTGQSVAFGPWKAGALQVSTFPGRVDLSYEPQVSAAPGIVLLDGSPVERFQEIIKATSTWVDSKCYQVTRVAIGGRHLHPCGSVNEAYGLFASYVQMVHVDYPRNQEVMFRINQPTESKLLPGLTLNRISTWNVITFRTGSFHPGQQPVSLAESHYLANEIDFNSAANGVTPISNNHPSELLAELLKEVEATLNKGIQ